MKSRLWLLCFMGMGCTVSEPHDPSWLQEMAVLAIEADPPALLPGGTLDVTVTAVDPQGAPLQAVVWACTPGDDGVCLERRHAEEAGAPLSSWAQAGPVVEDQLQVTFEIPVSPEAVEEAARAGAELALWAVACAEQSCGLADQVASDPVPGTRAYERVVETLADVHGWLGGVEAGHAAGAVMRIPVWPEAQNENPVVLSSGEGAWSGDSGAGALQIDDAQRDPRRTRVRGYGTGGPVQVWIRSEEAVELSWGPGWSEGGRIYVVVLDGLGGVGVWRGEVAPRD